MQLRLVALLLSAVSAFAAHPLTDEYALLLNEAPLVRDGGQFSIRALDVVSKQNELFRELRRRKIAVTGSTKLLLNAVFIRVPRGQRPDLSTLPNVKSAAFLPPLHHHLNKALDLVQVTAAWNNPVIGGVANAGAGVKIAIIDTGIDDLNPAFNDTTLPIPTDFPKASDPSFLGVYTNNKIIVARSYVQDLSSSDPQFSSPDDLSPIDRKGYGTAIAMIAAGETIPGPAATITGVAPKAYLGNYKIFGSPGVNDFASSSALIFALEDAVTDGMDIATLALGGRPSYGPLDADCQATSGLPSYIPATSCDVTAQVVESAIASGLTVVISAGDDGSAGNVYPTLGTINTPGTAPSAITVGATTNAHSFVATVYAQGSGLPMNLTTIDAQFGQGTKPSGAFQGPLKDVTTTGDDGTACNPLPANSLNGAVALVIRGTCDFATKANNVQAAGAIALLLYLDNPNDTIFVPTGLATTFVSTILIDNASGVGLKTAAPNGITLTLDPKLYETNITADQVAYFTSRGPSIGLFSPLPVLAVKPELAAVGADIYTATQTFDPNGALYDGSGFNSVQGTSFAVPLVAGAAALVKQVNSSFTPAQIKSALVNTATQNVMDNGEIARQSAVGSGKLDANDALNIAATCSPATLSFGLLNTNPPVTFPLQTQLTLTNVTSSAGAFALSVAQRDPDSLGVVSIAPSTLNLQPGASAIVTVQISGAMPSPGSYEGQINITGPGSALHVPYNYFVGNNTPTIVYPVFGDGLVNAPGSTNNLVGFRSLDPFGVPIGNVSGVTWKIVSGTGTIEASDSQTDQYGLAAASLTLSSSLGTDVFEGDLGAHGWQFFLTASNPPAITGVTDAGAFTYQSFAPGSYIAIFGTDLATTPSVPVASYLPLSMATTSVSFDVPSANISVAGALSYAGPGQVNVQVPWELANQTSAVMKVVSNGLLSQTQTISLAQYSPAFFDLTDPNGQSVVAALDLGYHLINSTNPIPRGQLAILFTNGLGPVDMQQFTGYPDTGKPYTSTNAPATVTIGGQPAAVSFAGLSPGSVSLYQLNVTVPSNVPAGLQPLTVTIGGVTSPASQIYVQ